MTYRLVLVVDQTEARLFSAKGFPGKLNLLDELTNAEGRLKEGDLVSDVQSGRTAAYEPNTSAKEVSILRFLRNVVTMVKRVAQAKERDLVVIAGPKVLGLIRPELIALPGIRVVQEINKDLSEQTPKEIERYLQV